MTISRSRHRPGGAAAGRWRLLPILVLAFALAVPAAAETPTSALPEGDRALAGDTRQRALETAPSNVSIFWNSPTSGNAGVVTPVRTYKTTTGYYCRVYRERVIRQAAEVQTTTATACRDDAGIWRTIREK